MHNIMFEGPWTINGLVLQLAPWHPYFQLIYAHLSIVATWLQLGFNMRIWLSFVVIVVYLDTAKWLALVGKLCFKGY